MIKLITQFDNEKTKLSLATPTCGCCCSCCCCCCIVSTFAAASISARNFAHYIKKEAPYDPKEINKARRFGFFLPLLYILLCFLSFCLPYDVGIGTICFISIIYLFSTSYLLNKIFYVDGFIWKVIISLIITVIFEVVGLICGVYSLEYIGETNYLMLAIFISILLIIWAFWEKYTDINVSKDKIKDNDIEILEDVDKSKKIIDNDSEKTKITSSMKKKECPKCGKENAIDNNRCFYCSNIFDKNDK